MTYREFLSGLTPKSAGALVGFPSMIITGAAMGWLGFERGVWVFFPSLALFAAVFWKLIPFLLGLTGLTRTVGLSLAATAALAFAALVLWPSLAVLMTPAR